MTNCEPKSVTSSRGAVNTTYRVKVCANDGTIMYLMPMSEVKGLLLPIVSIEILSISFRVDSTNREARMVLMCPSFGMWTTLYELPDVVLQVWPTCATRF